MFSRIDTPPLARRLLEALHLIRSFLLLEDDYDVDWEVDQDEPAVSHACRARSPRSKEPGRGDHPHSATWLGEDSWIARSEEPDRGDHPHRVALRSRLGVRRPGVPAPREQVCLCPLPHVNVAASSIPSVLRGSRPAATRTGSGVHVHEPPG